MFDMVLVFIAGMMVGIFIAVAIDLWTLILAGVIVALLYIRGVLKKCRLKINI